MARGEDEHGRQQQQQPQDFITASPQLCRCTQPTEPLAEVPNIRLADSGGNMAQHCTLSRLADGGQRGCRKGTERPQENIFP